MDVKNDNISYNQKGGITANTVNIHLNFLEQKEYAIVVPIVFAFTKNIIDSFTKGADKVLILSRDWLLEDIDKWLKTQFSDSLLNRIKIIDTTQKKYCNVRESLREIAEYPHSNEIMEIIYKDLMKPLTPNLNDSEFIELFKKNIRFYDYPVDNIDLREILGTVYGLYVAADNESEIYASYDFSYCGILERMNQYFKFKPQLLQIDLYSNLFQLLNLANSYKDRNIPSFTFNEDFRSNKNVFKELNRIINDIDFRIYSRKRYSIGCSRDPETIENLEELHKKVFDKQAIKNQFNKMYDEITFPLKYKIKQNFKNPFLKDYTPIVINNKDFAYPGHFSIIARDFFRDLRETDQSSVFWRRFT